MAGNADVQRAGVKDDAHLGLLCCRTAVVGIDLDKVARRLRPHPGRLVQPPVEHDRLAIVESGCAYSAAVAVVGRPLVTLPVLLARGRCPRSTRGCELLPRGYRHRGEQQGDDYREPAPGSRATYVHRLD